MIQISLTTFGIGLLFAVLTLILVYVIGRFQGRHSLRLTETTPNLIALYQEIQNLPAKILNTIQGSLNPQKGKVAELLTYAELRYDYDVIIPLGRPIDFIGIKNKEKIDFIEVKSSLNKNKASLTLTEEEKEIQRLIKAGQVNFRLVVVKEEIEGWGPKETYEG